MSNNENPPQELPQHLTLELAQTMFQNQLRIQQLASQAIATPQRDNELLALRKANHELTRRYQGDLLQGFLLYVSEYLPILRAFTPVVGRINDMLSQQSEKKEIT